MDNCPDYDAMMKVMGKCKELAGYRCIRACDMYQGDGSLNNPPIRSMGKNNSLMSIPIHGSELDWYYRGGAFAVVMEMGSHQHIPSYADTKEECDKTYGAFLHFLKEAPLVPLHPA